MLSYNPSSENSIWHASLTNQIGNQGGNEYNNCILLNIFRIGKKLTD